MKARTWSPWLSMLLLACACGVGVADGDGKAVFQTVNSDGAHKH